MESSDEESAIDTMLGESIAAWDEIERAAVAVVGSRRFEHSSTTVVGKAEFDTLREILNRHGWNLK